MGPPQKAYQTRENAADSRDQFLQYVQSYYDAGYRYALRLTGRSNDAGNLVQQATFNALRSFNTFRDGSNFQSWFNRIIRNAFYDILRKSKGEVSYSALSDGENEFFDELGYERDKDHHLWGVPSYETGLRQVMLADFMEKYREALEQLPVPQRKAFIMRQELEMPYSDIARETNAPEGTVKFWVHSAKRKLREILKEFNPHREETSFVNLESMLH